jgi:cysteinyl-tRNA synthetase
MSMKYLGKTIDIHTGGVDLMFPHHENEIAQSEAATGKPFVRYWLHNEHVMVEGKKMSKSLGNFLLLNDILSRGHDPRAVRYALLSTHYRSKLNITDKSLWAAQQAIEKLDNFIDLLKEVKGTKSSPAVKKLVRKVQKGFREAMDDDLNISEALAKIFDFIKEVNKLIEKKKIGGKDAKACVKTVEKLDAVLGVLRKEKGISTSLVKKTLDMMVELHEDLKKKDRESAEKLDNILGRLKGKEYDPENFGKLISSVIEIREALREKKEYDLSDKIRSDLRDTGIILEDKERGARWRVV